MDFNIESKPWKESSPPRKVLVIRYQATGDLVITLPYLNSLTKKFPQCSIHLLTRKEVSAIPKSLDLFDDVMTIGGGRNTAAQLFLTLVRIPQLLFNNYDIVIDLQHHKISSVVRRFLGPKAWTAFDRYSSNSAGERTRATIEALGLCSIELDTGLTQNIDESALNKKMLEAGWDPDKKFIVLNPAGAFTTRHWPIENFAEFARQWKERNPEFQFLVTGLTDKIGDQVKHLKKCLRGDLIDLTDTTDAGEAFALVRKATLVISEDSGLMHMAWVQGVPTLALFGSSNSVWSRPLGDWSLFFDSSDLPCGNCLMETCKFGDVHCLTRFTPEFVYEQAMQLIHRAKTATE